MPYIVKSRRRTLTNDEPRTPGELNYLISCLARDYVRHHGASYSVFNEVIGVLECAKLEFYKRQVGPYEGGKIEENGDIYNSKDPFYYKGAK